MKWYKFYENEDGRGGVGFEFEWSNGDGITKFSRYEHVQLAIFHEELLIEAGYANLEDESHWEYEPIN